ncbi:hypothetical protein DXA71_12705 [Parabacteroides distasonis]|nr:hypothetical protein DXA71_12705 [Parabacteroides distasonis]RKU82690.1 hypothetical protein DW727_04415 [Parabacteroides sp. AM27-42]
MEAISLRSFFSSVRSRNGLATETDHLYPTPSTGFMSVQQDGRQVNCHIVDKSGPIVGANVVVKGTTIGNISDMDGRAIIDNVPANAV